MKKNMTRLLGLGLMTAAMTFSATAVHATLIGDSVYGCVTTNVSGANPIQMLQNCAAGSNLFTQGNNAILVGGTQEFTGASGKLSIVTDFSANSFLITLSNSGTTTFNVPGTSALMFVSLDFQDGTSLYDVTGLSGTLNGAALTQAQLGNIGVIDGNNGGQYAGPLGGYLVIDLPALAIQANKTATLTGTFVTVPEPASLALLGVVLLVLGLVHLERVRLFSFRSTKLAS